MKRTVLILLLLFVATPAFAVAKKCPPKCAHRATECAAKSDQPRGPDGRFIARSPTASAAPALWDALVQGFELSAGWRWQTDRECPTPANPYPELEAHDPFYVGAGVRVPLAPRAGLFGAFDRDFVDEARWQARTGIYFTPFAGRGTP